MLLVLIHKTEYTNTGSHAVFTTTHLIKRFFLRALVWKAGYTSYIRVKGKYNQFRKRATSTVYTGEPLLPKTALQDVPSPNTPPPQPND